MWTSTAASPTTSAGSIELSPIAVIALEAMFEPFCRVAVDGGIYHEDICRLNGCTICSDLMLKKGGTA